MGGRADMDEQRECIQRPIKDIGETLYVICVTSMCMCMLMAMVMMSEKVKKEKR